MARMQEMARGIRDEHLNAEAMDTVERQKDLLSQLSDIQRKLQNGKVDEALKQLDQLGQDLEKLEKGLAQRAQDEQGGQYSEEAQKLAQAARKLDSGDFSEALEQAERSLRAVETLQARLGMEEQLAQRYPGFVRDPDSVRRGMKGVQSAAPPLREVVSELEQAIPRGEPLSPQQMQEMLKQQAEQRQIGDELQQARNQLGEVGRKVPIFGPEHEQMLQQAQEGMGRAEQRVGQGQPGGAQAG